MVTLDGSGWRDARRRANRRTLDEAAKPAKGTGWERERTAAAAVIGPGGDGHWMIRVKNF